MKKFFAALLCLLILSTPVTAHAEAAPEIVSETAVVIDAGTGQVLYDKNMNRQMYPASITKVLTGLLAVENGNLSDTVTVGETAIAGIDGSVSYMALHPGEEISLEGLMYGLAIESANDAANAIAEHISGSISSFRELMNSRAARAGAKNSHFENPNGLHSENHYTTAYDMAMITRRRVRYDDFNKIFSTEKYNLGRTNLHEAREFNSANWFLNGALKYDGLVMSKTGWTEEALHTMVTCAEKNGVRLICVVMKSQNKKDKWDDTEKLLNWAFDSYTPVDVSGEFIALSAPEEISLGDGNLIVKKRDITCDGIRVLLTNRNDASGITVEFSRPRLSGDLQTAQMTASLYMGETMLTTVNATATVSESGKEAVYVMPTAPVNKTADMVMAVIFGGLTFVAVMIVDILRGRRI